MKENRYLSLFFSTNQPINNYPKGKLLILTGGGATGSLSFILHMIKNKSIENNIPTGIYNFEIKPEYIIKKLLALINQISEQSINEGQLSKKEWESINKTANDILKAPIFFSHSNSMNLQELITHVRQNKSLKDKGIICLDYKKLLQAENILDDNLKKKNKKILQQLESLAKELNITVIAWVDSSNSYEEI